MDQGQCVDIDLLIRPKAPAERDDSVPEFRNMDASFSSSFARSPSSQATTPPTTMIEHRAGQQATPPEVEQSRHEKFTNCFSQIDANTFQTIPCLSMPLAQSRLPDGQISHEIQEYCEFIDGVLGSLLGPLSAVRVQGTRKLAVQIE
jgi:hypothetical protein